MVWCLKGTAMPRKPISMITERQKETLVAIEHFIGQRGYPPTVQELAEVLNISAPSVHENVNQLVRKGYLSKDPGKARSLVVKKNAPEPQ
jgi:repressor LexA